jgi:hypothetical protein
MSYVKTEYNVDYDILYILVGEPTVAFSECIAHDVYIRRDMVTERIAGVVIEEYSKKNKSELRRILSDGICIEH